MKKQLTWIHGNKARIETGYKSFDKYCVSIGQGNVWGCGQFSNFIRPKQELTCNGFTNPPGHLQDFDLKHYDNYQLHVCIKMKVRELVNANNGGILYCFYHYAKGQRVIHGFILTSKGEGEGYPQKHRLLGRWVTNFYRWKSEEVLNWIVPHICDME